MATLEDVVGRLDHVSNTLDQVAATQEYDGKPPCRTAGTTEGTAETAGEPTETAGRTAGTARGQQQQLQTLTDEFRLHRQELREMHRFNQQTRRMWILIARNMEWLPEDEDFD